MTQEEKYMREAVRQAKKAAALKEVPIGCVIVHDGAIIARGYNRRTIDKNVLAHAEIIAIRKACRKIGDWRLEDCTMSASWSSRWSRAPCAPGPSFRPGSPGWSSAA